MDHAFLPPRTQRRLFTSHTIPITYINLAKSVERRASLPFHFQATRFDAVSKDTLVERGPTALRNVSLSAYLELHKESAGAVSLTISHCQVLEHFVKAQTSIGLVLEDDSTAFLWGLSPIGDLDDFLNLHLGPHSSSRTLFLQRIIDPSQYPPLLLRHRVLKDYLSLPGTILPQYSSEVGLGGTSAVAWNAQGMQDFLTQHLDIEGRCGCPSPEQSCALDFDLKTFQHTASIMPPLIGAKIAYSSTIERNVSQEEDVMRHLQGEVTSVAMAVHLFETLSLMAVMKDSNDWVTAFQSLTSSDYKAVESWLPAMDWRVRRSGRFGQRITDNVATMVHGSAVLVSGTVVLMIIFLRQMSGCRHRRQAVRLCRQPVVVEMKQD
eukprot:Blabericola_migrator_1__1900@NODE_1516_length_4365_cov_71_946487_g648_i3_p2_GENE_NODE_1516_length_4365_cov_71_946487_g648_i3NODE_1516_length_4365_cov_71_946487_g648_i3_p2_ORF_typecomplete_len379_score49_74Glyco_transf_25/PF01755_17/7_1e10GP3/PF03076_14/2_6e03GP3/PF03076_14/0_2Spond_N/PF06468_13/0_17Phage_rep_org_N/PF09681_10/1_1e04Phage_rep_org_N/PF09681_10/0_3_NODE_1516_length_4365_cov_71_946487_g648_i325403676